VTSAYRFACLGLCALPLTACGPVNPNFQTIFNPAASSYTIAGSLTLGFSSHARVAFIEAEGQSPDVGSFKTEGPPGAGITDQGLYTPTKLIPIGPDGRFQITLQAPQRFAIIQVFAWDDTNGNGLRDSTESLATPAVLQLKKQDQSGWSFNAPDWNQFSFVFAR
jgi:hypothetical protein